jgi:hypothetical protein
MTVPETVQPNHDRNQGLDGIVMGVRGRADQADHPFALSISFLVEIKDIDPCKLEAPGQVTQSNRAWAPIRSRVVRKHFSASNALPAAMGFAPRRMASAARPSVPLRPARAPMSATG